MSLGPTNNKEYPERIPMDNISEQNGDNLADSNENMLEAGAVGPTIEIDEKLIAHSLEEQVPEVTGHVSTDEDMQSLGAASFDGDWDKFFLEQSVDELLEFVCILGSAKDLGRVCKALETNLVEEASATAADSGLGQSKVRKIQTIIKRIGAESNIEIRVQLLEILMKILYYFEDDFDILCSEGLKLKNTVDHLLEVHLNMENKEPIVDIEFQTLMEISEWIDRAFFTINQTQQFDRIG